MINSVYGADVRFRAMTRKPQSEAALELKNRSSKAISIMRSR
jgi:hypothetical protein